MPANKTGVMTYLYCIKYPIVQSKFNIPISSKFTSINTYTKSVSCHIDNCFLDLLINKTDL